MVSCLTRKTFDMADPLSFLLNSHQWREPFLSRDREFGYSIKPHNSSEGPRQGSCGVFLGMFHTIETTTMEYIISELALNYMNKSSLSLGRTSAGIVWSF